MKSSDGHDHRTAKGRSMHLTRGDILKRDGVSCTILVLSPCSRYALVARVKGKHVIEEQIVIKGWRKGAYNATKHSRRFYKGVWVLD
jgi:hypothetical protein